MGKSNADPMFLRKFARSARRLERIVREEWTTLEPAEREMFVAFVHAALKPKGRAAAFFGRVLHALIVLRGEEQALVQYITAGDDLIDAIQDAIEREHPDYEKRIVDAMSSDFEEVTDVRKWLDSVIIQEQRARTK